MFGDEEDMTSVRTADHYNYEALVDGNSGIMDHRPSCCEVLCGRPRLDEPKVNLICCNVSKRVVKNVVMFTVVLLVYIFFLSMMTSSRS